MAILLGLIVRNPIGLPSIYEPGLQLTLKRILRIGVARLGIRLSLAAAGTLGLVKSPPPCVSSRHDDDRTRPAAL